MKSAVVSTPGEPLTRLVVPSDSDGRAVAPIDVDAVNVSSVSPPLVALPALSRVVEAGVLEPDAQRRERERLAFVHRRRWHVAGERRVDVDHGHRERQLVLAHVVVDDGDGHRVQCRCRRRCASRRTSPVVSTPTPPSWSIVAAPPSSVVPSPQSIV